MKRILLILMMLALTVTMIAGCKTVDQEESASTDGYVENVDDGSNESGDGPVKVDPNQTVNGDDDETPSKDDDTDKPSNNTDKPSNNTDKPGNDNTKPDNNKKPDNSTGGDDDDEPTFEDDDKAPIDYSDWMTVATFNVKSFFNGDTTDKVEQQVRELDADIIGFQEISVYDPEYGNMHQIEYLAKKCGYQYWDFVETVDNSKTGRGQYGHGILSKYPIKSKEHVDYNYQHGEHREYARYVLDVDGTDVVYYNTHLATEGHGKDQYKELLKRAYTEKNPVIITGDFNLLMETEQKPNLDTKRLLPMIGLEDMTIVPHRNLQIDNILISPRHWDYYLDESETSGVMLKESDASDHYMIWTYLKLK